MRPTNFQRMMLATAWHWNAHGAPDGPDQCNCDQPPYECPGCLVIYPFGLIAKGQYCGDCVNEQEEGRHVPTRR